MTTTEVAALADGLSKGTRMAVECEGQIWGMPLAASWMRPLVRRGLFDRVERRGFQTRWALTPLGLAVRNHLLAGGTMATGQPNCSEIADQAQLASGGA